MAVYRWIYGNAKMEGDRKDYHVRLCDAGLKAYRHLCIELSNRLLSADKRRGEAERQICWFSGYLDRKMYVIAAGGDQRDLLGIEPDGYRAQHCVLAYGFTDDDICLYRKKEEIFEPLIKIMRRIQISGADYVPDDMSKTDREELRKYVQAAEEGFQKTDDNILKSVESTDEKLWKQSLNYPVMTGIVSREDAQKLLRHFPDGMVTVLEDVRMRYETQKDAKPPNVTGFFSDMEMENKESNTDIKKNVKARKDVNSNKDTNKSKAGRTETAIAVETDYAKETGWTGKEEELERLKQEQALAERRLMEVRAEKHRKEAQRKKAAVLFFFLMFFALVCWFLF